MNYHSLSRTHLNRRRFFASSLLATAGLVTSTSSDSLSVSRAVEDIPHPWTEQGQVPVGGGNMHWLAMGNGEPLVLLPKLGGWVADWRHIAPILATRFRVIAIDNPGHGQSLMYGNPPYLFSLTESAAMLMATLDALNIERFSGIGNSLGGCILTIAAALWPEKFRKLVLISVKFYGTMTMPQLAAKDTALLGKSFDAEDIPIARDFETMQKRFGVVEPRIIKEQNASRAQAGKWVAASERGVGRAGISNYLARILAPTLLLYGEREDSGYKDFESVAKRRISNAHSSYIRNSGAFPHQESPTVTANSILSFLDQP